MSPPPLVLLALASLLAGRALSARLDYEGFLEEIHGAMLSRWEILSDIRSHVAHNRMQVTKLVEELEPLTEGRGVNPPAEGSSEDWSFLRGLEQLGSRLPGTNVTPPAGDTTRHGNLTQVIGALQELYEVVDSTEARTDGPQKYLPCEPPFQEIAYRMCILQETRLKLTWDEAWSHCWQRGAKLAQDDVVIKARRFLNQLYGETGSRTRWPIWVGGRALGGDGGWQWADGSAVPAFLWAAGQPRHYSKQQTPKGVCMYLDGYSAFYGASLPCHRRRRFVCQRRD